MVLRLPRSCKRNNFASDLSVKSEVWRPRLAEAQELRKLRKPLGAGKLTATGQSAAGSPQHPPITETPKMTANSPSQHLLHSGSGCSKHRGQCQTVNIQRMAH